MSKEDELVKSDYLWDGSGEADAAVVRRCDAWNVKKSRRRRKKIRLEPVRAEQAT